METIAITEWNGIVSPLFDAACTWSLVHPDGTRTACNVKNLSLIEQSELCTARRVKVMICGAISAHARSLLEETGVRVIAWICGDVASVIEAFTDGEEIPVRFAMPGSRGTGCRGRRGRGMCHRGGRHDRWIEPQRKETGGEI